MGRLARVPSTLNQKGGAILSRKDKRRQADRRESKACLKRWREDT